MARGDFRKRLTDRLIEFLGENDGLPWQEEWAAVNVRPFNPATGVKYRGGNVLNLMFRALERESDDPRWMTLKQANVAGYSIKKGAKGELVEYWDWGQQEAKPKRELDAEGNPVEAVVDEKPPVDTEVEEEIVAPRKPLVFYATVFNGSDIVGLPEIKRELKWQPNEIAEQLIAATGAKIEHRALSKAAGGQLLANRSYYETQADGMVIPPRSSFKTQGDYYATTLHELAHWTGHPSRLDRKVEGAFGTPEYAKEELRAEIAAVFLKSMLGVDGDVKNHARYASHWVEVLKKDKHELFRAAKDAEKIVDHIFEYAPELKALVDSRLQDNLLPKDPPRRKRDSGVGELPNFLPPEATKNEPAGVGRQDPRWASFEASVASEAKRYSIPEAAVEETFGFVEERFTELMNSAERNGFTVDDMNSMLVRQLVEEMRANDDRRQQWDRFADQVREAAVGIISPERVDLNLQNLHQQYLRVVQEGAQNGWDKEQIDHAVRGVVYGQGGRTPITPEFVKERFFADPRLVDAAESDAEDEVLLVPIGATLSFDDAVPADAAAVADERIAAMP